MINAALLLPPTYPSGWGLFVTAPHVAWHLEDVFRTLRDAKAHARVLRKKRWVDAYRIVRMHFDLGRGVSWERKPCP